MFCPQCGQQQVSDNLRFCSRCGFPVEGVLQLLASGGVLPYAEPGGPREISPRRRGVRQGAILLLAGVVLVPMLGLINSFTMGPNLLDILVPLAAILFFVGGIVRMLFAAIFEEGAKPPYHAYTRPPVAIPPNAPIAAALPPAAARPTSGWRSRPSTAEIRQPSSVTENTTRLLDKDDPQNR